MLKLSGIKKDYITASETVHALKGINLCFRKNEFVSILGPSGCGKTTLLNIIGGLDHYTDGDLIINGRSTKSYRDRDWDVYRNHRVGFIFQSYNLIPHQTVLGNVELALTISGVGKEERIARAKEALDKVGLKGQYYKRPNQLSGGQCQRVAIARALVNDPEILLADEPTGALDTVTSVQIMELIKEISAERLVVMVTHNPELAEQYSSRIIRLLDGEVTEDTNPLSEEDEERELLAIEAEEEPKEALAEPKNKKKSEKAKMSFWTAFKLSARNLISKKGRTIMVGIAGSIGIVGIACVLAFSAGIKGYIASMQDDMLSGNPIEIAETGFSASAITDIMEMTALLEKDKLADKVYITSTIENLAEMSASLERLFASNTLTEDYIKYVLNMPRENYEAMLVSYGINLATNVFTDFTYGEGAESEHISVKRLIDMYTSVLKETAYAEYSSFIPYLVPSLQQAPPNSDYILSQYDLLGGSEIADEADEIMLVLNPDEEISDLLLAAFGYYTQEEFLSIVDKAINEDEDYEGNSHYREYFDYDELVGKEFVYYPTDSVFTKDPVSTDLKDLDMVVQAMVAASNGTYKYNSMLDKSDVTENGGLRLKVVGILTPKETVSYGCLTAGIYYTEELTEHILETNAESEYISFLLSEEGKTENENKLPIQFGEKTIPMNYSVCYGYYYYYDDPTTEKDESKDNPKTPDVDESENEDGKRYSKSFFGLVSPASASISPTALMGGGLGSAESDLETKRDTLVRNLGGNSVANNVLIYPKSFEEKNLVTEYLDAWSDEDATIIVDGRVIPIEERTKVTYTDTLELVIKMINTMIDIISYALIAFTSISLVVSTVMIGIITYVSVVERVKEIGVIRSLGGRKRDVSALFNAETFIIGLLAGFIGVVATYGISTVVNIILKPLIGYPNIAALPALDAVVLVALSVALTLISGLIPARSAAKKDPVVALRTE